MKTQCRHIMFAGKPDQRNCQKKPLENGFCHIHKKSGNKEEQVTIVEELEENPTIQIKKKRHCMTSINASNVKKVGHKIEDDFAKTITGEVIKGTGKTDVTIGDTNFSVKKMQ